MLKCFPIVAEVQMRTFVISQPPVVVLDNCNTSKGRYMVLRTSRFRTHGKGQHIDGTPWNALSVVSGALRELSRALLKFLSVRHAVLYSDGYPLAVIGPLRHHFHTTSFPESHISVPRVSCFIPYITIPPCLKSTKKLKKMEITNIDIYICL